MQELVDIRNLTLACMFLNMFSIAVCVVYMLWTKQSIIDVMMTNWVDDDGETNHITNYTVPREGRFARVLNTNNDPPFYNYYISIPITDDEVVRNVVKHDRIMSIGIYTPYCISVVVNPTWMNDPKTLTIVDSLVNDAWIKLTEIQCKKSVDDLLHPLNAAMGLDPNKLYRFVDSCTGPFYDFKYKPIDELGTKPATPTGTFHDGKPSADTVDSPVINQSVFNDPDYVQCGDKVFMYPLVNKPKIDQISDKIGTEVARPKVEI